MGPGQRVPAEPQRRAGARLRFLGGTPGVGPPPRDRAARDRAAPRLAPHAHTGAGGAPAANVPRDRARRAAIAHPPAAPLHLVHIPEAPDSLGPGFLHRSCMPRTFWLRHARAVHPMHGIDVRTARGRRYVHPMHGRVKAVRPAQGTNEQRAMDGQRRVAFGGSPAT